MSYYTLTDGQKLYYEDRGQGPDTLIMMHGWTSTHDIYVKPTEVLQKQTSEPRRTYYGNTCM